MSALSHTSSMSRTHSGRAAAPPDSNESVQFGEFLRHAREDRGLTIQQISSETKIPCRHLDSLEHGRLFEVPGGTYRRGEIIAYANAVGLDRTLALAELDRVLRTVEPQQPAASIARPASRRSVGLRVALFIGLGAAAIAAVVV